MKSSVNSFIPQIYFFRFRLCACSVLPAISRYMASLCSPGIYLLKWTWVIEWDNLKTQGLGLLLASIFSEERHLSHCLLNLFVGAIHRHWHAHRNMWTHSESKAHAHAAALPQPASRAIDKYWSVSSAEKEMNMSYTHQISVSRIPLLVHSRWVTLVDLRLTRFEFKISVFMISFPCMPPIWTH